MALLHALKVTFSWWTSEKHVQHEVSREEFLRYILLTHTQIRAKFPVLATTEGLLTVLKPSCQHLYSSVIISLLCLSWKRFHSIDWLDPRGLQLDRFRWFRCLLFRWPTASATRFPSNPRVDLQAHISRKPSMLDGQIHVSSPWLPIDFTWFYLKSIHIDWFGPWIPTFWVEWYLEIQMIDRKKCHWPNRFPMLVPS